MYAPSRHPGEEVRPGTGGTRPAADRTAAGDQRHHRLGDGSEAHQGERRASRN
ncbi:hypothetical protein ACFWIA_24945 [Streptomyces sp. NPDC127068]|uniref:hypothetical protein n=1 Tax=Streptomyces sp. NPDC127068 TaxID=3347127 RepID=UPI003669C0EA